MKKALLVVALLLIPVGAIAWDGYDYENGNYIEIEGGNLVRSGNDIEIFDYDTGDYKDVEVESINGSGGSAEIEVYDYDTEEYRTFDMDQ